jgi:hypothetical protein
VPHVRTSVHGTRKTGRSPTKTKAFSSPLAAASAAFIKVAAILRLVHDGTAHYRPENFNVLDLFLIDRMQILCKNNKVRELSLSD